MKTKLITFFTILLVIFVILFLWWTQAIKPANIENTTPVSFTIETGESNRIIADKLQKQNLIRSSIAFFLLTRFGGYGDKIQAGDFQLKRSDDLITITKSLTHGTIDTRITIPEGWRIEEIAVKLTKELGIPEEDFLKDATEGYMFPDTYEIPKDATGPQIVKLMKNIYSKKIDKTLLAKAVQKNLTEKELIIISSLVEREAKSNEDRPIIASVILNRLKIGMKLDIDATIQYALGYQSKEKSWWKKELTLDDINTPSPYNTYLNSGLPPTPICNPGLAVVSAVINAPQTDYLFYISDTNGKIHPAKTIEEHNANVTKYLNK